MASRLIGASLIAALAAAAIPCCVLSPREEAVTFTGQRNVIVWDEARGVQHFMREAQFSAKNKGFSFIAPTPSVPELEEVDPELFIRASVIAEEEWRASSRGPKAASIGSGRATLGVKVLQEKDVAGFRAATLKASDPAALQKWLKDNAYQSTRGTEAWLDFYVRKNWVITAFKVQPEAGRATTGPIRMSFKTEKPFNPFRVPQDNVGTNKGEGLQLYFVSRTPVKAFLGDTKPWKEGFSFPLEADETEELMTLAKLPSEMLAEGAHMTVFHDPTFPVANQEDLFFEPEKPSAFLWATGGAAFGIILAGIAVRRLRAKRAA